jgi:hypothetical protein
MLIGAALQIGQPCRHHERLFPAPVRRAVETWYRYRVPFLTVYVGVSRSDALRVRRLAHCGASFNQQRLVGSLVFATQDWMKGRRSEVDDLNGLVAAEAARLGRAAPVNAAIAELAHRVEQGTIKPDQANLRLLRDLVQR